MKIIDLSVPLQSGIISDPEISKPEIEYSNHDFGAKQMESVFRALNAKDLKNEKGWASESIKLTSHSGTHMDAPYHFSSVQNNGKHMETIDEIPLENFIGSGVKLDFRKFKDGHVITADEVEAELNKIGHHLCPGEIVVVNTSAGKYYGQKNYLESGIGMGRPIQIYGQKIC